MSSDILHAVDDDGDVLAEITPEKAFIKNFEGSSVAPLDIIENGTHTSVTHYNVEVLCQ